MQRKKGTEELLSKKSKVSGGTVIYELNSMRKILSLSIFYAEIAQIRNKELYKQSFLSSSGYSSNSVHEQSKQFKVLNKPVDDLLSVNGFDKLQQWLNINATYFNSHSVLVEKQKKTDHD